MIDKTQYRVRELIGAGRFTRVNRTEVAKSSGSDHERVFALKTCCNEEILEKDFARELGDGFRTAWGSFASLSMGKPSSWACSANSKAAHTSCNCTRLATT